MMTICQCLQIKGAIPRVMPQGRLNDLALASGAGPPIGDRPLVTPQGRPHGVHGPSMDGQGPHESHSLC